MIVSYEVKFNPRPRKPLTAAEIEAIEAHAPRDEDIVYDEDCPEMTEEQLKQFRRVHPRPDDADHTRKLG